VGELGKKEELRVTQEKTDSTSKDWGIREQVGKRT